MKTPRTSTPSLKHITCAPSKSDKTAVDHSGKKTVDHQIPDHKSLDRKSKVIADQKRKTTPDQQCKVISDKNSKAVPLDQKKKVISDQKSKLVNDQQSKVVLNQRSKGGLCKGITDQQRKEITSQKKAKLTDQKNKMANQNTKPLSDRSNKRPIDKTDHNPTKKGPAPMVVTANNIDSFIDQIAVKPKLSIKKYSTRSTVKQSNSSKTVVSKNLPPKKLPTKNAAALQKSYKPVSPVVKLQQKRSREMREAFTKSTTDLSTFDFDDDVMPPIKKSKQINSSANSSCSSSVDVSMSRVNNQKKFDMVPQKKGKKGNKKQPPVNKRPITTPHSTSRTEVSCYMCSCDIM